MSSTSRTWWSAAAIAVVGLAILAWRMQAGDDDTKAPAQASPAAPAATTSAVSRSGPAPALAEPPASPAGDSDPAERPLGTGNDLPPPPVPAEDEPSPPRPERPIRTEAEEETKQQQALEVLDHRITGLAQELQRARDNNDLDRAKMLTIRLHRMRSHRDAVANGPATAGDTSLKAAPPRPDGN